MVTAIEKCLTVRSLYESVNKIILLLIFNTAGVSVLADCMARVKGLEELPCLLRALPVCVPGDNTIVVPFVSSVELYAAASVEQGDDDDPHDVDVDPPVVFTYNGFSGRFSSSEFSDFGHALPPFVIHCLFVYELPVG